MMAMASVGYANLDFFQPLKVEKRSLNFDWMGQDNPEEIRACAYTMIPAVLPV